MVCHTCNNSYIGQAGRKLDIRYKEHIRYTKNNNGQSACGTHVLNNLHNFGPIDTTITLIHKARKGKRMNTLENITYNTFNFTTKSYKHKLSQNLTHCSN
jgi:hypothetical protein